MHETSSMLLLKDFSLSHPAYIVPPRFRLCQALRKILFRPVQSQPLRTNAAEIRQYSNVFCEWIQAAARSLNDCILRYGIKYTDIKLCRAYKHGIKTERKSLRLTNFQFLRPLKKFAPCSENRFILQRRPLPIKKVTAVEIGGFDAVFGGRLPRRSFRNR